MGVSKGWIFIMNSLGQEFEEVSADIGIVEVGKPHRAFTVFDKFCRPSEDLTVGCQYLVAAVWL